MSALGQSGWPVRRTPRWLFGVLAVVVAGGVLVALAHRPSTAERASDLRGFLHTMQTDIESCAGGVSESLDALHEISTGASHDTGTAVAVASYGAQNCSPANSMPMDDLTQYQVPESLASFNLQPCVNDLVTWGFPLAQRVQTDVADILTASGAPGRAAGNAALAKDRRALDAKRTAINGILDHANAALGAHAQLPSLPG
ncbi:MAG: hypothetical protein ACRDNF_04330 [Streptosporangiaceae bacterium]